jgi:hypothetical protein
MEQKCADFAPSCGKVSSWSSRAVFGIAAEIELIFPSEIQTRLRKSTPAERHTIDRVIGDAAENPASVMPINKLFPFSEDTHRGQRSASTTKARAPIACITG